MTSETLLGIPLIYWGLFCLVIAAVYFVVWPKPNPARPTPRSGTRHFILRYFHSLVWLLLAAAAFAAAFGIGSGWLLAILGLVAYLVFMVVFVRDRQEETTALYQARKAGAKAEGAGSDRSARSDPADPAE
jgi:cobalamin synthase